MSAPNSEIKFSAIFEMKDFGMRKEAFLSAWEGKEIRALLIEEMLQ
jgi:hypothetical protein